MQSLARKETQLRLTVLSKKIDIIPLLQLSCLTNVFLFDRYRVIRYEFSLKTINSISVLNTNTINSQVNSNLLVNLELSNQQHQVKSYLKKI
jgi:hypothetical protein